MIKITNTIRQDGTSAEPSDVLEIKTALFKTGHYPIPRYGITAYPDKSMFQAIKKFQTDVGLKVDGVITPHGETLTSLNYASSNYEDNGNEEETPRNKSPIMRCPTCGAPHGGSSGDECPDCATK